MSDSNTMTEVPVAPAEPVSVVPPVETAAEASPVSLPVPIHPPLDSPSINDKPDSPLDLVNDGKMPKGIWLKKKSELLITIYIYKKPDAETFEAVMMNTLTKEAQETAGVVELPVAAKFTMPTRKQIQRYRERSGRWVEEASSLLTDKYMMRQWLLKYHLVEIDLPHPETGEKMVLKRDKDGKLMPESESLLDDLHPSILDIVMTKYEREADLMY